MTNGTLGWPVYTPDKTVAKEHLPQMAGYYEVKRKEDGESIWALLDPRAIWHYIDKSGRNRSVNYFDAHTKIGVL